MYGDTQLCWVNNGGKTRDLELWIGTRKICGFKDVCEMELLEEILHISGNVILNKNGDPVNDSGETFDEVELRHQDELDDRPDEDDIYDLKDKIEQMADKAYDAMSAAEEIQNTQDEHLNEWTCNKLEEIREICDEIYGMKEY